MQNLATAPTSPSKGLYYFNTTDNRAYIYNGTIWEDLGGMTAAEVTALIGEAGAGAISNTSLSTEANDAIAKRHTQNTDAGTTASTFYVGGTSGAKIKNNSGNLQVRNSADSDYANIEAKNIVANGTLGVKGSTTIGDNAASDTLTVKGITKVVSKTTKALGSSAISTFKVEDSAGGELFSIKENGDTVIAGVLTVNGTGTTTFGGDVSIGGALNVADGTTASADMSGDNLTLTGDLNVNGNTNLGDNASVDKTTIKGFTSVHSKATKASGSSTINAFQVVDSAGSGLLEVRENGNTIIGGVLTVSGTGQSTFAGDVNIAGSITVADSATVVADFAGDNLALTGNLAVAGNTTLGDNAAQDTTTIKGVTKVVSKTTKALGSSSIDAFKVEDSAGSSLFAVKENGDTSVGGALTVAQNATVNAAFTGADLRLTGNLVVDGNTTIGDNATTDTLTVKAATVINSKTTKALGSGTTNVFKVADSTGAGLLEVKENGNTVIGGVLTVSGTGTSTFSGNVDIGGSIHVTEGATVDLDITGDDMTLTGDLTVEGNTVLGNNASEDTTTIKGFTKVVSKTTKAAGSSAVDAFKVEDSAGGSLFSVRENGDTVIGGVLTVNGTGASTFAGNVNIAGSISVAESATVNANFTGNNLNLTGNLAVNGNTTLGNDSGDTTTVVGTVVLPSTTTIGGVTQANISDAVSKKHTQNTDVGTTASTFYVGGTGGVKVKHSSGELQVRNSGDTDYANLRVKNLYTEGPITTIASNEVNIGDSEILLNSDVTTAAANSDGGIAIKRLKADNVTRADAKINYNNSSNRWEGTYGNTASTLKTKMIAHKYTETIGDGAATSYLVSHGLGTRDVTITVAETASPYAVVFVDVERTTTEAVTIKFGTAPSTASYSVTIVG
jgi:hypothetical protein